MDEATIQSFEGLEFISVGKSGMVYGIDEVRVIKEYFDIESSNIEYEAYEHLHPHPNIAHYYRLRDGCLIIERGQQLRNIHKHLGAVTFKQKLDWLIQAAKGIEYIHNQNIVHADVGCHNMIVTQDNKLKIIDFEGCSINGAAATSCYEWFSYRRSIPKIDRRTDIFAFGCAIFEIVTGSPPFHEHEASSERTRIVEDLYARNIFPNVQDLPLRRVMENCWHSRYRSMSEIIRYLRVYKTFTSLYQDTPLREHKSPGVAICGFLGCCHW